MDRRSAAAVKRAASTALDAGVRMDLQTVKLMMLTVLLAGQAGLHLACLEWAKRLERAIGQDGASERWFYVTDAATGERINPDSVDDPEAAAITWAFRFLCAAGNGDEETTTALIALAAENMGPGGNATGSGPAVLMAMAAGAIKKTSMAADAIKKGPAWRPGLLGLLGLLGLRRGKGQGPQA